MKEMALAMECNTPFLPLEIITNILKRLPVKSLIRFQCVCKHWKNLFKTPSFIADHLHHSSIQSPSVLFRRNGRNYPLHLCLLDCEMQVCEVQNAPLIDSLKCAWIVGSSNGLLCVEHVSFSVIHSLFLWNPAIGEIRQVPRNVYDFKGDFCIGFGFSPIVNDYKILRAYIPIFDDEVSRVEVYSLNTGTWKEIEFGNLEDVSLYSETVTANGAMFWLGSKLGVDEDGEDDIDLIVSFDITMELFTFISMPALDSNSIYRLTVYQNKLAVLSQTWIWNSESSLIDLWVMEESIGTSRERCSWTKKYTVSTFSDVLDPLCIWRNKIVCNVDEMPGLIGETECEASNGVITIPSLLNLRTNELKNIGNRRCGNRFSVVFNHAESLVPVSNIHIEEP